MELRLQGLAPGCDPVHSEQPVQVNEKMGWGAHGEHLLKSLYTQLIKGKLSPDLFPTLF